MAVLKNLNQFLGVLLDTLKNVIRVKIWGVLLLSFAISALLLYAHYNFLSPLFYGLVRVITSSVAAVTSGDADSFYHYPTHFLYLPWFFGWVKLILSVLIEVVFVAMAALLFYRRYNNVPASEARPLTSVFSSWPQLVLVALVFNLLVTGVSLLVPGLMTDFLEGSPRRQLALELGIMPFFYTLFMAMFLLALPSVAVYRQPFHKAIVRSLQFFVRRPFSTFFTAMIILAIPILVSAAANHPDIIIDKFRPELVFWLLLIGLLADVVANFIWMGTSVRYLIDEE